MSSDLDKPAFPHSWQPLDAQGHPMCGEHSEWGLSGREYAAIQLRVPMSGNADLDAMILKARQLDLAGCALASVDAAEISEIVLDSGLGGGQVAAKVIASMCLEIAGAVIAVQEGGAA